MNKLYFLLITFLILIIFLLSYSIFFSDYSYSKRNELMQENSNQKDINTNLEKYNEILEFEIKNAQSSDDHVENFAREELNLTYPEEDFISFKKQEEDNDKN
tara:strand:+ start:3657 stop:3962 length:306 start_codon:yes stop_codon:yes gene_type:complete